MKLQEYINSKYEGAADWFVEEVGQSYHTTRVSKILDTKAYLDGVHDIVKRPDEVWNNRTFKTRKLVLQYVKPILSFQSSFLLKENVTLTSDDPETLEVYKNIYKRGKYPTTDIKAFDKMLKYGEVFEFVFYDGEKIKSKIINAEDGYPVYNHKSEYIGFIEHYVADNTPIYIVYTEDSVKEYVVREDSIRLVAEFNNISGLPVHYILPSEQDELSPRSDLEDWKNIVDQMEDLISKYTDSFYKFLNPIPVIKGTKLNTEDGINQNIVGQVMQLDFGSEFGFEIGKMDYQTFKEVYKTLHQSLLNISMTPSISMNSTEISNLSETSMKILFYMAVSKASMNSKHLYEGFDERWKRIKKILQLVDKDYTGYIDCVFKFDIPQNDSEVISNLKMLTEMGAASLETVLAQSPYTNDIIAEMKRLESNSEKVVVAETVTNTNVESTEDKEL